MVPEDPVLVGYHERVFKGALEDPKIKILTTKRQASHEFQQAMKDHDECCKMMTAEKIQKLMIWFYKGRDLVYSDNDKWYQNYMRRITSKTNDAFAMNFIIKMQTIYTKELF